VDIRGGSEKTMKVFALLLFYAAQIGGLLQNFRYNGLIFKGLFLLDCLTLEDGTDMLSRNVGK
jgi:hypothetical protein